MTQILSKPDHGALLIQDGKATLVLQRYLDELDTALNANLLGLQVSLTSYTVLTLPAVTTAPGLIFVSDESGGSVPAFSDGTDWRRVTDRAVVS